MTIVDPIWFQPYEFQNIIFENTILLDFDF